MADCKELSLIREHAREREMMSNHRLDSIRPPATTDQLFAPEIDEGAIIASIATVIIVVGIVISTMVNKHEAQSAAKILPSETVARLQP
jgi:hypothetical protein